MKGALKTIKRAPHMLTSKVGMAAKSTDPETDELVTQFAIIEDQTAKFIKDAAAFRDAVTLMLTSQTGFATAFANIFQPIMNEPDLTLGHPDAAATLHNTASYQQVCGVIREQVQPEIDLLGSRVIAPLKEFQEQVLKRIRKAITKREHKLVDYDRFNNSYQKIKNKAEKSLSDEKSLYKHEQDLTVATEEYERYNNLLKADLPPFLVKAKAFYAPVFQTFYFVKIGILYALLEKFPPYAEQTYGPLDLANLEEMYLGKVSDARDQYEALTINKRFMGTSRMMSQYRGVSASTAGISPVSPAPASPSVASPPPYSASSAFAAPTDAKRAPPPPPASRPGAASAVTYVTALYDYTAQAAGDLSFKAGDKIELVKRTESDQDWWTGKLNGVEGVFPGNYVQA